MVHDSGHEWQVVQPFDLEPVERVAHRLNCVARSGPHVQSFAIIGSWPCDLTAFVDAGIIAHGGIAFGRIAMPSASNGHRASGHFDRGR